MKPIDIFLTGVLVPYTMLCFIFASYYTFVFMQINVVVSMLFAFCGIGALASSIFGVLNLNKKNISLLTRIGLFLLFIPVFLLLLVFFIAILTNNQIDVATGIAVTFVSLFVGLMSFIVGSILYCIGSFKKR